MNPRAINPQTDTTWDTLALLRFALAGIVVACHLQVVHASNPWFDQIADLAAYAAILCFLVISGFSIAHSLARSSEGFYRRRIVRIYPLYFLAVVVPPVMNASLLTPSSGYVLNVVQNLFFLQGWTTGQEPANPVVWTLSIEVCCYLLAPWLARRHTIILILLGSASLIFYCFSWPMRMAHPAFLRGGLPLFTIGWAWMAGFIFYRYRRRPWSVAVLGLVMWVALHFNSNYCERRYQITIAAMLITFGLSRHLPLPGWLRAVMTFSGDVSYPLYLLHFPVFMAMTQTLHISSPYALIAGVIAVAIAFALLDGLMRKPTLQACNRIVAAWRRRFPRTVIPQKAAGVAVG